ncbi:MAG TPA: helix-turn-helix transcriptional regulator [Tepidisphaeraceae bacterium]|jgi:DNA-binding XRE family transcriptional regulator
MVAQMVQIAGKRLVILEESDYLRLCSRVGGRQANQSPPTLPPRNPSGRRPAAAYILASIANEIAADRKAAGLTQQQLARRAGIRQETLSRIESGKHTPKLATLKKIDRVLGKVPA